MNKMPKVSVYIIENQEISSFYLASRKKIKNTD